VKNKDYDSQTSMVVKLDEVTRAKSWNVSDENILRRGGLFLVNFEIGQAGDTADDARMQGCAHGHAAPARR
jgi:hypothetical protein